MSSQSSMSSEFKNLVQETLEFICEHIDNLANSPTFDVADAKSLAEEVSKETFSEGHREKKEILEFLFKRAIPKSINTAGPGYMAYIPGGGLLEVAVADLISNSTNRYVGVWSLAPVLVQIESNVIKWFCQLAGLDLKTSGGFLTSGGSLANFSAVFTARRTMLDKNFLLGTIYVSDQTHQSMLKAALLAGFPLENVREVKSDSSNKIICDELVEKIKCDIESGFQPFMIIGNGGTTNTGAVDPLQKLGVIAEQYNCWFHVDAAYGGFFLLTKMGKKILKGIELADSITLDPHKGLFLPYGTGALIVKEKLKLRQAHSTKSADYLPEMQDDFEKTDFCEISPELSRDFRGLRVWLPLQIHGVGYFRKLLQEKLDHIQYAQNKLKEMDNIEIIAPAELSTLAFRYNPKSDTSATLIEQNEINQKLLELINSKKRVNLTSTIVKGKFVIRICILSFRTDRERVEECILNIKSSIEELLHNSSALRPNLS